jgi:hypothetical protein
MSIKRAILIGCNYTATPSAKLQGCIRDVLNVSYTLIDAYGYRPENITFLRDDVNTAVPTRANILATLKSVIAASANYSELWIHYSGHGTQVKDKNGDEKGPGGDGLDEAIVPSDFQKAGMITDDEIYAILNTSKCRTLVFFDSCNSGSACDLPYSINYTKGSFVKSLSSRNTAMSNTNIIMMSGCRDPQTSADAYNEFAKSAEGAFTMSLLGALRKNDHNADIMKIYGDVCSALIQNRFTQIPVLSSSAQTPSYQFSRSGSVSNIQSTTFVAVSSSKSKGMASTKSVLRWNMKSLMSSN